MLPAGDFAERIEMRMDLDGLLETLPPRQAAAIRATRIEGYSAAETAAAAGMRESALKVFVHRGIKALIARMGGEQSVSRN